jgi:thioredoxin-like negative regulator of GroEL
MKAETFTDPALTKMINSCFIPVEVDTDQNEQFARQLRIESVPTTMVISPDGDIVERREGFQSATQLKGAIARFCRQPAGRPIVTNEPRSRFSR